MRENPGNIARTSGAGPDSCTSHCSFTVDFQVQKQTNLFCPTCSMSPMCGRPLLRSAKAFGKALVRGSPPMGVCAAHRSCSRRRWWTDASPLTHTLSTLCTQFTAWISTDYLVISPTTRLKKQYAFYNLTWQPSSVA